MAGEKRKAAVCIGVAQAGKRLPYLPGAMNGARAFHAWASALGYDARLVIDDPDAVTLARLRRELEDLLRTATVAPIHRLILYFAGHGLIREVEEGLWLLSDWDEELRAVAVEGLKRRLYMHGIKQIAIFADACRGLPPDVQASDLTPDSVLGRGPIKPITNPEIDKFISAQDGSESYMVPGDKPEDDRCIFSGVLLEGLWGTKPAAFSTLVSNKITSQSLATYLKTEVPQVANRYKFRLNPNASPTFSNGDDIYFGDDRALTPPTFPQWPPPDKVLARMGLRKASGVDGDEDIEIVVESGADADHGKGRLETFTFSRGRGHDHFKRTKDLLGPWPKRKGAKPKPAPSVLDRLRAQPRPSSFETWAGFAVQGAPVRRVWAPAGILAGPKKDGDPNWWHVGGPGASPLATPVPVCIESADGLFFAASALPRFIGSILCDDRGALALVYREIDSPPATAESTEEAIAALESGSLRADRATDFAVQLRQMKHLDPVLGVISAYLYDSIGDAESIRRMAYYYIAHDQPIPYDIALLAQLEAERREGLLWVQVPAVAESKPRTKAEERYSWTHAATPEREGIVGGLWPWMRQGWTFLDEGSSLVPRGVLDLRKHLQPARFSTFNAEGAGLLSELFGLAPNERPPVSGEKAKEMPIAKNRTTKGATKPSPKKRVADTEQGTAKKPTRKATKSHEQD